MQDIDSKQKIPDERVSPIRVSPWLLEAIKDAKRALEKRDRRVYTYAEILERVWKIAVTPEKTLPLTETKQKLWTEMQEAIKIIATNLEDSAKTLHNIATKLHDEPTGTGTTTDPKSAGIPAGTAVDLARQAERLSQDIRDNFSRHEEPGGDVRGDEASSQSAIERTARRVRTRPLPRVGRS